MMRDIIVMMDIILKVDANCDIIVLSKLISIAMMTMEGNWNLLRGRFLCLHFALKGYKIPDPGRFTLSVGHSVILSLKHKQTLQYQY